jgi:hypothetical protein
VREEEDILGLAYSETDLQSTEHLNLEGGLDHTRSFKKFETYKPFISVKPSWHKERTRETLNALCKGLCLVKGGADESNDHPAMFLPGRVLHMEDSERYAVNM